MVAFSYLGVDSFCDLHVILDHFLRDADVLIGDAKLVLDSVIYLPYFLQNSLDIFIFALESLKSLLLP